MAAPGAVENLTLTAKTSQACKVCLERGEACAASHARTVSFVEPLPRGFCLTPTAR